MKLSQFLAPDRVTLEAAHGECYRCIDENAKTYTTRRDRAEQAMVARAMKDPEFAALCSKMTDREWSRFLDATCGVIPGKDRTKKNNGKYKVSPEVKALFDRMKAEGYVTLWELSDLCGQPITRLRNWIGHGFMRDGVRTVMQSVREGRYVFTRVEWMEAFVSSAPPSIATGTPRKNAERVEV
mgnify:FL=1